MGSSSNKQSQRPSRARTHNRDGGVSVSSQYSQAPSSSRHHSASHRRQTSSHSSGMASAGDTRSLPPSANPLSSHYSHRGRPSQPQY